MAARYYIRRDHMNSAHLIVTTYWDGRAFSSINAKGYTKASAARRVAGRLCKQAIVCNGNELTICATDY